MRYSTLKLLSYISEASGFGGSSTPAGPSSVSELFKKKPVTPKSGSATSKGKKRIYPGVDPNVMGKNNKVGQEAAEAGQLTIDATLNMGKGLPGAGSARIAANTLELAADRAMGLVDLAVANRNAQQEGVRSMSNVSNFYKNLGQATIPLAPKASIAQTIADYFKPTKK
jgi:hypothetical protein